MQNGCCALQPFVICKIKVETASIFAQKSWSDPEKQQQSADKSYFDKLKVFGYLKTLAVIAVLQQLHFSKQT